MSTQAPPEAAGPGVERGDGAIIYGGDQEMPRVVIDGLPTPEERKRNAQMPSGAQCRHCQGIPLSVLAGLTGRAGERQEGGPAVSEWDELAGLSPTAGELGDLIDVLTEVDAGDPPGEDYGPWDDSAGLAGEYGYADVAELANGAMERERTRADEDAQDARRKRPGSEDVLARALDRAARGTYLPAGMYRDRDEAGRWAAPERACGAHLDDFGRCGARYHDAACLEVLRGSAATSDATAVEAWNRVLRSGSEASAALLSNAHRTGQDWDEVLAGPGPGSADVLAYMREQLGIGGRADLPQPARPAAGSLAEELWLK